MFQMIQKLNSSLIAFVERVMAGVQAFIHAIMASSLVQKATMFAVAMCMSLSNVWATSTGAGGFTKATTEISSYQTPVANLMKAIAAVIVLVGAFNVYFKMQNGDQDVKKTIMMTIGGCVAFIAMSEALPLFFK